MIGFVLDRRCISAEPVAAHCGVRARRRCRVFDVAAFECLDPTARRRTLDAGQTLFFEGDCAQSVYIVAGGCIKLYKMLRDGRRQIVEFLSAADLIGLPIRAGRYALTAEAVTRTKVTSVSTRRLEQLGNDSPAFARRLLDFFFNELLFAQDQILLLGRKTAVERMASFLVARSQRQEAQGGFGGRVDLPMLQTDIADHLGLRHETVSRVLAVLRDAGAISFQLSDRIIINDGARLVALAGLEGEPDCVVQSRDLPSRWDHRLDAAAHRRARPRAFDKASTSHPWSGRKRRSGLGSIPEVKPMRVRRNSGYDDPDQSAQGLSPRI